MRKMIQKKMAILGVVVLLLAAIAFYLLLNSSSFSNRFWSKNRADSVYSADRSHELRTPYAKGDDQFAGSNEGIDWLERKINPNKLDSPSAMPPNEAIERVRNNPPGNSAFYQRVRNILEDPTIEEAKKLEVISTLDRIATPAALQLLAELSQQHLSTTLKSAVLGAIARVGEYYWDKQSLEQAYPILIQLWSQSDDPEILKSVAAAMTKLGDPASINVLLDTVLNNSKSMAGIENSKDVHISAAWFALQNTYNSEVVAMFQQRLQSGANILQTTVCANLLAGYANLGYVDAREDLISWAKNAGDQYASAAHDAFSKFATLESQNYLKAALAQNLSFKSSLVKSAILSVLQP
jgi:hypothetical protein